MADLRFPNPVNEHAARVTAGLVVLTLVLAFALQLAWVLWPVAAGFALRVVSGPKLSPFGLLSSRVIAPRLWEPRLVPGPPKQFAQGIGLAFSLAAAISLTLGATLPGWTIAGWFIAGVLVVAASLESFAGFCLACWIFGLLMRAGVIPDDVCKACADVSGRIERAAAARAAARTPPQAAT